MVNRGVKTRISSPDRKMPPAREYSWPQSHPGGFHRPCRMPRVTGVYLVPQTLQCLGRRAPGSPIQEAPIDVDTKRPGKPVEMAFLSDFTSRQASAARGSSSKPNRPNHCQVGDKPEPSADRMNRQGVSSSIRSSSRSAPKDRALRHHT